MSIQGMKVGIIGGSIAGCAAAIALSRGGCTVEVFERSSSGLKDRGSGIAIPGPLRAELIDKQYLPVDYPNCEMKLRWWQFHDGSVDGRRLWTQPTPAFANNWGNLWSALRGRVPNDIYREGKKLESFDEDDDGVSVRFADGTEGRFDLLIGADGYDSVVRKTLHPAAAPEYAGYVLWRGNYPEAELDDTRLIRAADEQTAWLTVPFPGGHGVVYMIPDFDGNNTAGHRRVNWAIYADSPKSQNLDGMVSVPPGQVSHAAYGELQDLITEHFPPSIRSFVAHSRCEDVSIQPIYDSIVNTYVGKRTLLIGDAGTITRPHTASGATKALEDALALETLAKDTTDISELLSRYDAERCVQAKTVGEIGKRIGQAQVIDTPDWGSMTTANFEDWTKAILAGDKLYLYGENA